MADTSTFIDSMTIEGGEEYVPRECNNCKRWLKKSWRGDICSRCQYKAKYQRNVLNRIRYKFKNNPGANPFINETEFESQSVEFNKKVCKFVGIHFTDFDNNEALVLKLNHFRKVYIEKQAVNKEE